MFSMRVLVTGATGFIGSYLSQDLLNKGFEVTGISRNPRWIGTEHWHNSKDLHMKYCNIANEDDLMDLFGIMGSIDGVIHMAGQPYRNDSPGIQPYFRNNLMGTINVLECCRAFDIKKFIFASSYAVYGLGVGQYNPIYLPVDESHIVKPYDFYDASKFHAEQICRLYYERFGIESSILRYAKVYGPGLEEGVVYNVIQKALQNLPIELNGDISIDFLFVSDAAKATLKAFERVSGFQIFNIGGGHASTLYSLCSKIIDLTKSRSQIKYTNKLSGHLSLDISKARSFLDYHPTKLEDGLLTCINFIRGEKSLYQL